MNRKNLLFIAYELPPRNGPHALRIANFCRYLHKKGWNIFAIGSYPVPGKEDPYLEKMLSEDDVFYRVRRGTHPFNGIKWAWDVARLGHELCKKKNIDVVLTSAPLFVAHLAGYFLSLSHNKPWVLDYGDPFAINQVYKGKTARLIITKWLERRWLNRASCVVLTTEVAMKKYKKIFGKNCSNITFVPMGFDPSDFDESLLNKKPEKFILSFSGSLHLNSSPGPYEFYKGVETAIKRRPELINDIFIRFIGTQDAERILKEALPVDLHHIFNFHGLVPFNEMQALLKNSFSFLFWGFNSNIQIPSKIYVYLGLRKPVLAIVPDPEESIQKIVSLKRRGIVVKNDREDICNGILELHDVYTQGDVCRHFNCEEPHEYKWENLSEQLSEILSSACSREMRH